MLLISDLHLREDSADVVLNEVLPAVAGEAERLGDKHVGILGDVFHIRYRVSVRLLNALRDELMNWMQRGLTVTIIPGNHDQINVAGRNALEVLGDVIGVDVYTEPTWDSHGLWFPYRKPELVEAQLKDALSRKPSPEHPNVLFTHLGIYGAWMNDGWQDKVGLPPGLFEVFDFVICGHYHKHQYVGRKLVYVGSPYQTRADEAGQVKGYGIWNGSRMTHVPMEWGKRHLNLTIKSEPGVPLTIDGIEALTHRDIVRLTVTSEEAAKSLGEQLTARGVQHIITVKPEVAEARITPANESLEGYARAYLEAMAPADLDRKKLGEMFVTVVRGTQ